MDLPKSGYGHGPIKGFYLRNQLEGAVYGTRNQIIPKRSNPRTPRKCHNIRCSEMVEVVE